MSDDDMTETLAPKSDQLDAVDLINGDRLFTIEKVSVRPGADQPVSITLKEFPRVWRPSKTQRRLLAHPSVWATTKGSEWVGKQVLLGYDGSIKYAGKPVGGIVVRAASGVTKPVKVTLPDSQQTVRDWTVKPLPDAPTPAPAPQQPDETATLTAAIASEGIETAQMPAFLAWASEKQLGRRVGHPSELTAADRGDLLDNLPALAADFLAEVAQEGAES